MRGQGRKGALAPVRESWFHTGGEVGEGLNSASQYERPDSKWHIKTAALIG